MPRKSVPAKRLARLLCVVSLFGALQAWAGATPELDVGDQSGLIQALLHASRQDQGLAYRLDWHPFTAGTALMEALNAAAIDIGVVGNAPPVFAQAGGFEVRVVAAAEGAQNNNALLVQPGSTIRQLADLKGKRLAVAKGTSGHYLLLAALAEAGLEPSEVSIVYASPVDAQNAFASGKLDGWAVWSPFVGQATARGAQTLLDGSRWAETGLNFTVASLAALNDPEKAALLGDFIQRLARAQAWATANPEPWAAHLAQVTRLPLPLVKDMLARQHVQYVPVDARVIALQQRLADRFAQARLIPRPLQVAEAFDDRFNTLLPQQP
ncbi:aliphatic sulfonates ABC transporter substrate-binding protein [Pseudomonas sp. SDI]|uniref:aliphatic sulfonate ABC transporter substrate-binding protein n=1 Tax=Pseudomonas sp. SDI TaxID=2170734 RepID=UPI000DE6E406|nr:aliphatic sulfonate ABC transporter substrate-binding protein [Pseudomonas sp. SDI]PWB34093.1 aliphatic sulfonates ABC transporter substrate-binding protein [Pseudomonas sp. SDI]